MADEQNTMLSGGGAVADDHREIDPRTGQQKGYIVLTPEERAKGFVRPVRRSYIHEGIKPTWPLTDLTPEEFDRYEKYGYVKYEQYLDAEEGAVQGRFWTADQLKGGCGTVTTMSQDIAETYARDPKFYGGTFCCGCRKHLPLEEFVWKDNPDQVVGS